MLLETIRLIECVGWRRHSSLIFLILLFTKPNIEVSGWLYQTKTHITHIVYKPFSMVMPPTYIALPPVSWKNEYLSIKIIRCIFVTNFSSSGFGFNLLFFLDGSSISFTTRSFSSSSIIISYFGSRRGINSSTGTKR